MNLCRSSHYVSSNRLPGNHPSDDQFVGGTSEKVDEESFFPWAVTGNTLDMVGTWVNLQHLSAKVSLLVPLLRPHLSMRCKGYGCPEWFAHPTKSGSKAAALQESLLNSRALQLICHHYRDRDISRLERGGCASHAFITITHACLVLQRCCLDCGHVKSLLLSQCFS